MVLPDRPDQAKRRLRSPTILEPIDELFGGSHRETTIDESPPRLPASSPSVAHPSEESPPYRPSLRPPMAIVCAFDDGQESGEIVRIRVPSFVIGRSDGNLMIPHDAGISGRHAEIGRRMADDRYRWYLRDLASTNGTFVRTLRAVLLDGQEFLIGGTRFRFDLDECPERLGGSQQKRRSESPPRGRPLRNAATSDPKTPSLIEISPSGEETEHRLSDPETWIGSDAEVCNIFVNGRYISPRHALIKTTRAGRWVIENARSRDGIWLRIHEIELGRGAQFQCGEQRFLIRIP